MNVPNKCTSSDLSVHASYTGRTAVSLPVS